MPRRVPYDLGAYVRRTRGGPCFICEFLRGPGFEHHTLYEDDVAVAFLARSPDAGGRSLVQAWGYTLVVPRAHREDVIAGFTPDEYRHLQDVVYRVGAALHAELPVERLYVLSLGSRDGNSHVHWHVVPLPPGVPYDEQQFRYLMAENGVLEVTDTALRELAGRLRRRLAAP